MSDKLQGGVKAGSTSVSIDVVIRKAADNTEETGLTASGLTAYYWRQGGSPTAISLSDLSTISSAYSSGGVKEADATHMKGTYRLDVPDAAFATGADWVEVDVYSSDSFTFKERLSLTTNVVQTGDSNAKLGAFTGASLSTVRDFLIAMSRSDAALTPADLNTGGGTFDNTVMSLQGLETAGVTPPANFSSMVIDGSGRVDVSKVNGQALNNPISGKLDTIRSAHSGTAQAGSASSVTLDSGASAVDNFYQFMWAYISSGTGAGQIAWIESYVGSTKVASIAPNWRTNPDNTSNIVAVPVASPFDEIMARHLISGSTGFSLNGAGSAGDPWSTTIPGSYAAGTAGNIVGSRIDANVSSRVPTSALPANFSVLAITSGGAITINTGQIAVKKNTALNHFMLVMTDNTNHAPLAGLSVTAQRNIDGAGFGACANAVSEIANGWYQINLAAADLNGTVVGFRFSATGADDKNLTVFTQA